MEPAAPVNPTAHLHSSRIVRGQKRAVCRYSTQSACSVQRGIWLRSWAGDFESGMTLREILESDRPDASAFLRRPAPLRAQERPQRRLQLSGQRARGRVTDDVRRLAIRGDERDAPRAAGDMLIERR